MNMVSVVTGDLVEHGSTAEYEHLRVLLATLVMPFFVIPGNNDSREGMREAFGSEGYLPRAGFLHYAIEQDPLRIVALDTHIPGEHGGLLCAERLAWFELTLEAAPERPTVVLMHHPPFATGIAHMDRYGLRDTAAFGEIVSRNRQIECILCAICIARSTAAFAGTVAGTAPSTAHQVLLDLEPEAPLQFASSRQATSSSSGARARGSSATPRCPAIGLAPIRFAPPAELPRRDRPFRVHDRDLPSW